MTRRRNLVESVRLQTVLPLPVWLRLRDHLVNPDGSLPQGAVTAFLTQCITRALDAEAASAIRLAEPTRAGSAAQPTE